jgi:DnaK suppressor protein
MREKNDRDAVRARLIREHDAAIARLRELGVADHDSPAVSGANAVLDEADEIQINEHRELGLMNRQRLAERINRLTAALQRLDEGTYGRCTECGEPIEAARLRALPEAVTCLRCQERLEARNEETAA